MTKLDHALHLASLGFHIFPIVADRKAPPAVANWQETAMRDSAVIRSWWGQNPNHNIGIFTGKFQDDAALLVVDVDVKGGKNGFDELLRLELAGWELPDTVYQSTPTGGRHYLYRVSSPVRQGANILGSGLDVRSKGGYVVATGSTVDGAEYRGIFDAPIADAPQWLIDKCGETRSRRESERDTSVAVLPETAERRAIQYLQHEAPLAVEGLGGDDLTYKVAARVKDIGVLENACVELMAAHWNARCSPPWMTDDLQQKIAHAYRYGNRPIGAAAPEADFTEKTFPDSNVVLHPYDQLNTEYAFVLAGGGAHILWETTDVKDQYRLEHLGL